MHLVPRDNSDRDTPIGLRRVTQYERELSRMRRRLRWLTVVTAVLWIIVSVQWAFALWMLQRFTHGGVGG